MRIRIEGQGPIWEEVSKLVRDMGYEIVARPPYDVLLLANVRRIVPQEELSLPRIGALCFHPSLLPRHRGYDAVYWTIAMGDTETGITWFWPNERIDAGPIAIQKTCAVPAGVSPGRLYYSELVHLGVHALDELLPMLERGEKPMVEQDESKATYEPGRPQYV